MNKCSDESKPSSGGSWLLHAALAMGIAACDKPPSAFPDRTTEAAALRELVEKQRKAESDRAATAACTSTLSTREAAYVQALDKRNFWDAQYALGDCPTVLSDARLLTMQKGAARLHYLGVAGSPKANPGERLFAIDYLRANAPADAERFEPLVDKLKVEVAKEEARNAQRLEASEKARKRQQGVSIGMSQADVLASSWGKPRKVNRSTYSFGVHEQWVYDGGYLYFKDGVLDSIQN